MHISQSCKRKGKHLCLLCENRAPFTCAGIFLKTKSFFPSVLAFRPQVNGVFGHQTRRFSKTVPRVDFFFKNATSSFSCGRKRRFSNTMMSYIIAHMPCKRGYRIFIVLAFSCWQAKGENDFENGHVWTRPKRDSGKGCFGKTKEAKVINNSTEHTSKAKEKAANFW